ncbi:Nn.00g111340.m01.CDS01 [Neocucurbitaria sp. VM-36]
MSEASLIKSTLTDSIKRCQPLLIRATQSLIQAASPNPPGEVSAVASAATALVRQHIPSSKISVHETAPGITNIVAVLQSGRPGRTLVFSGHLDTYPIGDVSQWNFPPLGADLSKDGTRLYGRGAADMKGGIAALIVAMRALAEHQDSWNGNIILALAGDEESMGTLGTAWLLEHVHAVQSADAVIVGDAGSPLIVRTGEKGLLWLEITSLGKSAHGAHVHRGVNAIEALMMAIQEIKELEKWPIPQDEVSHTIEAAKDISEPLSGAGEADVLRRITVNVGTISGGTSMNLVPDTATARLDIRLPRGVVTAELKEHINGVLSAHESLKGLSCRVLREYDPTWTSLTEDIVECTLDAARDVIGPEVTVNMRVGASDARLYRQRGIPTVVVGLTPYNMGGPDEYLEVEELGQVAEVHALAAFDFLKANQPRDNHFSAGI